MPGSRLSEQDRRRIEAGLGAGLGYAEISRMLGRPTSTISREVARNGGPARYRADHAQRATEWRAHRRTPSAHPVVDMTDGRYRRDAEAVEEFAGKFVDVMLRTGMPPMAARVLVCLMMTDTGALTGVELAAQLRVSRASVSKAVAYLETLAMLGRERSAGQRRERYVIDDDMWLRAWADNIRTNAMWADTARQGADLTRPAHPAGARLHHFAAFFTDLNGDMSSAPATAGVTDALTVVTALAYARRALSAHRLITALHWSSDRLHRALHTIAGHPSIGGPLTVHRDGNGRYACSARLERLNAAQLDALDRIISPDC